jgi:1,4-alpha-glucan branching enzyme
MATSQAHISPSTPMGASLVADGAAFRLWAPGAEHVYVVLSGADGSKPDPADELIEDPATGH